MISSITIEDYNLLPDIMLDNSKECKYIQLLNEDTISYYYYTELKKDIYKLFVKFNDSRYFISLSKDFSLKSNMNGFDISRTSSIKNDKVSNYVEKKIDLNIWSKDFYNILIELSHQLTFQESIYLIGTFFESKTEENLSDILGICRKSLHKIKKSCLVKLRLEFKKYNLMD